MQSPTNSSTSSAPSQPLDGQPCSQPSQGHSAATAASSTRSCGSRIATKWPEDKLTATRLDDNFWPTPDAARQRFVLVCGLIARERVSINKCVDHLSPNDKEQLFKTLEEMLEYPANMEESVRKKEIKVAMSEIAILQRRSKTHIRAKYVRQDESPFAKHGFYRQKTGKCL